MLYCDNCYSCHHCFGCTQLKSKSYCIFNKQYSEAKYNELVPKLITHMQKSGEWGEFFPYDLSPFCYNETMAHEYFPLTKEEALERGFRWRERDEREYRPATATLSDSINEVDESICNENPSLRADWEKLQNPKSGL